MSATVTLRLFQNLPTSGARAAAAFSLHGHHFVAIPQLAQDIPGGAAGMNLGDSDVPLVLYRADGMGKFTLFQELPLPGGEDAEFFSIGDQHFLATASLRSGKGPYSMDVESIIFNWDGNHFVEFQRIPTFAAKQWRYFCIDGRHFLALAQGVEIPGVVPKVPAESAIFQWDGAAFKPFQTVPSKWGYNWLHFSLDGHNFLAYADHVEPSILLRWDGQNFVHFQTLAGNHGRAFCFFKDDGGVAYLGFSRISSHSLLYRWDGSVFQVCQSLDGQGGREFAVVTTRIGTFVIHVKFITGSREDPNPALDSVIYRLEKGLLKPATTFATLGGTDVALMSINDQTCIVVTESLTKEQRFRTDTRIFQFIVEESPSMSMQGTAPFQSPEFLDLFTSYTASKASIGSQLTATVTETTSSYPLLVATSFDMLLFPGGGQDPSYINFRLTSRGFKELAAISHLGPAMASLVQMHENGAPPEVWKKHAGNLLAKTRAVQEINSASLWQDLIQVEAYRGRESAIASIIDYACSVTQRYLELVLHDPAKLTAEFLRENYLEATGSGLDASVPFNAVMIATFFLVGLDTSYRMRQWFKTNKIDWKTAMVLITGRQGRETSGVTISTSSVAQVILQSSNLELPAERLYIAPHGAVPTIKYSDDADSLRQYEHGYRSLWNGLYGMAQLGETMFAGYPAFKPEQNTRPVINTSTITVSELPKISSADDWFSMITRMRVVVEDARQLLSGCVTDYAAEQLRLAGSDLSRVIVPGLDGVDYTPPTRLYDSSGKQEAFTISSCPFPLQTDLPVSVKTVNKNGGVLAYRESGPLNGLPIIWIHGLPLDSRSWTAQFDHFSKDFHNIFVDLRGYGSSSKLPLSVTDVTQLYCDDLLALAEHLKLPPATIVGFASAGHIALRFSAQNPSHVSNLVLLNGSPRFKRNNTDYAFGFSDEQINDHFLAAARSGGIEALADRVLDPTMVFQDLSSADGAKVDSWFRDMCYNAGVDTLRGFFAHMVNDDDRHLVPLIEAPTLLLSSSLGKEVPAQTALFLRQHLQNARLVEIPDADHFFHVTRPVVVNELISAFLAQLRPNGQR
jgi:pimeloyl-ACP methyl ester carboxylesterase